MILRVVATGAIIVGEPVAIVQAAGGLAILVGIWVARPRQ